MAEASGRAQRALRLACIGAIGLAAIAIVTFFEKPTSASTSAPKPGWRERAREQSARAQLDDIQERTLAGAVLSESEIAWLTDLAKNGGPSEIARSLLILGGAVSNGQFEEEEFSRIAEDGAKSADGGAAGLYLRAYAAVLTIPAADAEQRERYYKLDMWRRPNDKIDVEERLAIRDFLTDKGPDNRVCAAWIMIVKEGLLRQDLGWVRYRVGTEIDTSEGKYKTYWKFVERVVLARNPDEIASP
ncbi:MAG: hypothetical protein WD716_01205 [Fimbriimonadaceae bacterium]